ncbi:hypothetical protein ACEPAI_9282 [Sanghuangporus weigelae]
MPARGLSCSSVFTIEEHEAARPWILSALKIGYRYLDTAVLYGTEGVVGKAVRESGIPREEIFVTTKLPLHQNNVSESIDVSLKKAGLDYYDLPAAVANIKDNPLPRYPGPNGGRLHCESDGVANFSVKNLKKLLETAKVVPAVNEVEMQPHQAQPELLEFYREKGIVFAAYSPTGFSFIANDPTIVKLAENTNAARRRANLLELPTLSKEEVELINTLHKNVYYFSLEGPKVRDKHESVFGWTCEQMGW